MNDIRRNDLVKKAIAFTSPERIPIWFFNRDQLKGDILAYGISLHDENRDEWGYEWKTLDDGTMGQPNAPVLPEWDDLATFTAPALCPETRMKGFEAFTQEAEDRYRLASLGITGFTLYTFLRGFENSMTDFVLEKDLAESLLDRIVSFECDIFRLASKWNFDGVLLCDDWGSQEGLIIAPTLWREIFRPRYEKQVELAHELGLHLWFHCCGNISEIIKDMYEIGIDVINISQPNVVDVEHVGSLWRGKQCFMVPISYQTVSITGTPKDIHAEARRLVKHLGAQTGGFIGYIEDYSCMGMSEKNYQACASAFMR